MPDVVMPRLSDSMEEGTILRWLKAEGDTVARGEELCEIETDKATMTYEADADGVLHIVAAEGDTLPIGQPIAVIGEGSPKGEAASSAGSGGSPKAEGAPTGTGAGTGGGGAAGAQARAIPGDDGPEIAPPIDSAPDDLPADAPPQAPVAAFAPDEAPEAVEAPASAPATTNGHRIKASPVARRIARERGVDLATVSGTGPGGRIVRDDVESAPAGGTKLAAAAEGPSAPAESAPVVAAPAARSDAGTAKGAVTVVELSRIQQVIARRMAESKATVPEFTLQSEIDVEAAVALRGQLKSVAAEGSAVPSFNDMVVKACALALREYPRANGSYKDGQFELHERVNVGVAVAADDALVVPTVFDADSKSLGEIARDSRALAQRVRAGAITPPELSGGTFTVSNLGMYGITNFTAVINPPQAAILAVGSLEPRAVVRDGEIVVRNTMNVTLACDHRILYGADAAQFLARVRALLEQPLALAL